MRTSANDFPYVTDSGRQAYHSCKSLPRSNLQILAKEYKPRRLMSKEIRILTSDLDSTFDKIRTELLLSTVNIDNMFHTKFWSNFFETNMP